jgi:hypothetical protein
MWVAPARYAIYYSEPYVHQTRTHSSTEQYPHYYTTYQLGVSPSYYNYVAGNTLLEHEVLLRDVSSSAFVVPRGSSQDLGQTGRLLRSGIMTASTATPTVRRRRHRVKLDAPVRRGASGAHKEFERVAQPKPPSR